MSWMYFFFILTLCLFGEESPWKEIESSHLDLVEWEVKSKTYSLPTCYLLHMSIESV